MATANLRPLDQLEAGFTGKGQFLRIGNQYPHACRLWQLFRSREHGAHAAGIVERSRVARPDDLHQKRRRKEPRQHEHHCGQGVGAAR